MPFTSEWEPVDDKVPCRQCGAVGRIQYRMWESSDGGHEDVNYQCLACKHTWWVEGSDA